MKPLNYPQANKLDPPELLWHNNHINIHYYYIVELQDIWIGMVTHTFRVVTQFL